MKDRARYLVIGIGAALSIFALGSFLMSGNRRDDGTSSEDIGYYPEEPEPPMPTYSVPFASDEALIARLPVSESASPDFEPDAWLVLDGDRLRLRDEDIGAVAPGDRYPDPALRAIRDAIGAHLGSGVLFSVGLAVPESTPFGLVRALFDAVREAPYRADGSAEGRPLAQVSCVAVRTPDGQVICTRARRRAGALAGGLVRAELRPAHTSFSAHCETDELPLGWPAIDQCLRELRDDSDGDVELQLAAGDVMAWRDVVAAYSRLRSALDEGGTAPDRVQIDLMTFGGEWRNRLVRYGPGGMLSVTADDSRLPRMLSGARLDVAAIPVSGACLVVDTLAGEGCLPIYPPSPAERTAVSEVWVYGDEARFRWPDPPGSAAADGCNTRVIARDADGYDGARALEQGAHCIVRGIVARDQPELEEVRITLGSDVEDASLISMIDLLRETLDRSAIHSGLVHLAVIRGSGTTAPVDPSVDAWHR